MPCSASTDTSSYPSPYARRLPVSAAAAMVLASALALSCGEWEAFERGRPSSVGSTTTLDDFNKAQSLGHLALAAVMARNLSTEASTGNVLVDYLGLHNSEEASYLLDRYLEIIGTVDPARLKDRQQRLAYWINGYNAAVIKGVLANFKGDSNFKVTDLAFFDTFAYSFGGVALTLNQVEHGVVRGVFDHPGVKAASSATQTKIVQWHKDLWAQGKVDSRVHAAFNCAALSCPNLMATAPHAFTAAALDKQLDAAVKAWLDSGAKGAGKDGISKLFDWYKADFQASHGTVDAFIKAHRTNGLTGVDSTRYLNYDWTLNIKR